MDPEPQYSPPSLVGTIRRLFRETSSKKKASFFIVVLLVFFYIFFVKPPSDFPVDSIIIIEKGTTLSETSRILEERSIIRSPFLFKSLVILSAGEGGVVSGEYFFKKREGVFSVVRDVTGGEYGLAPKKVILPEGATVSEMAHILADTFPSFDADNFLRLAKDDEGYLFPDTYLFLPNVEEEQVYQELRDTFDERVGGLKREIERSGSTLHEIITMASLLEEEARTQETREIISGILWKRLEIGMALQVDAVFPYIIGKNTFELTLEDLEVDSPYNTYKYRGLPLGPISNPGLVSIGAALNPAESPYLFYLSDKKGVMHYSPDFEGHKINKAKYLR